METNITAFIIFCVLLIPLFLLSIDFVIKGAYILYWETIFKKRFNLLFEFIINHPQTITERRKTVDGKVIISLNISKNRPREYIIDFKNNTIKILGTNNKILRMITSDFYIAPREIKIPKKIKNNISNFISIKEPDIDVFNIDKQMKECLSEIKKEKKRIDIRKVAHNIYSERSKVEKELYKIINLKDFTRKCEDIYDEKGFISKNKMNEIITNKLMEYSYNDTVK